MLNIQLFFEGKEVELNKKVSFPLNKSFENLWNPTDIIVEYSKSINIPATKSNNRLMANAYRIDRQFAINEDNPNIGMYLDPLKRIPMKLVYNGTILLDGYAKYTSATVNSKETYYTFNLYGALGDIFQTMMDCVVDENKLTDEQRSESDGGKKYVIECPWEKYIIDKDFVKNSWDKDDPSLDALNIPYNYIGMAPAYRGLYSDFSSNSVYALNGAFVNDTANGTSVEEQLKYQWKVNLKNNHDYTEDQAQARVDSLDFNMILPNGLSEHNMRQFRSYEQKPYIYIHGLFALFRRKCRDLTGYTINLDPNWFNVNNPYWSRLCYMLDYLSTRGVNTEQYTPFGGYSKGTFTSTSVQNTLKVFSRSVNYTDFTTEVTSSGRIRVSPFNVGVSVTREANSGDPLWQGKGQIYDTYLGLSPYAHVIVNITFTNSVGGSKTYRWWGAEDISKVTPVAPSQYKSSNFNKTFTELEIDKGESKTMLTGTTYVPIPSMDLGQFDTNGLKMTIGVQVYHPQTGNQLSSYYNAFLYQHRNPIKGSTSYIGIPAVVNNSNYNVIIPNTQLYTNWRTTTTCELKNLYTKEEPLFKIMLQYTKMFGLIWKPDYSKKTIDIITRATYFKDFNVVDWSDKVDKSKGMTIEPVSFSSKYVKFNYDDVNGYRYSGYRNKFGVDYGEKKLQTKYNFDTNETALFNDKIGPSSVSCQSFATINDLRSWDTISQLPMTPSEIDFIDCENDTHTEAISLNNWYFRCPNKATTGWYKISDVSERELNEGNYYWYGNIVIPSSICVNTQSLPQFSPVYKTDINGTTIGCMFNCPNEDYTKDKTVDSAKGNYIYDICWNDYINERYNANNKKVTCYVKLNPIDFEQFNFKTFVTIDNQLFVVNRVVDYDVNANTTKCELIQVTNIGGYTEQKMEFPGVIYSVDEIHITTKSDSYGVSGSAQFKVQCWPSLNEMASIKAVPISVGSSQSHIIEIEPEYYGNYVTNVSFAYESDGTYTEEWELVIEFDTGEIKKIPVYING